MKKTLLLLMTAATLQSSAQNLGKRYEFINTVVDRIPTKSSVPYYDTTVRLEDETTAEQLAANEENFFKNVFGSDLVKKVGKHTTTAAGTYAFSIKNTNNPDDQYTVNYWLDITVKGSRYDVVLHDFTIEHQDLEINIAKRLAAAKNNDGSAKQLLAIFHSTNMDELKKVYKTMSGKAGSETASK